MSSSQSFSFTLLGVEAGKINIPEATYKTGNEKMMINPVEIIVLNEKHKPVSPKKNQETIKPTTTREKKKI